MTLVTIYDENCLHLMYYAILNNENGLAGIPLVRKYIFDYIIHSLI